MNVIRRIYEPFEVKRHFPANFRKGDEAYFGGPDPGCRIEASDVASYRHVLLTSEGIIYKNGISQAEYITCYESDFKHYRRRYLAHVLLRHKRFKIDQSETYLLIFDNYSGPKGFAHWVSDGLKKLVEVTEEMKRYTLIAPYYFEEKDSIYEQTLRAFDFKAIVYLPKDSYVWVRQLVAVRSIGQSGDYHPVNAMKLRDYFWNRFRLNPAHASGGRLYISRKKATRRYVENEEEVMAVLKPLGFKTVCMEEHSFEEQLRMVFGASHVMSIHGAALSHIHFMRPGTSVFEFRKRFDGENCMFYALADVLSVNYYYQFCDSTHVSDAANNFNLLVDIPELRRNLDLFLETPNPTS